MPLKHKPVSSGAFGPAIKFAMRKAGEGPMGTRDAARSARRERPRRDFGVDGDMVNFHTTLDF